MSQTTVNSIQKNKKKQQQQKNGQQLSRKGFQSKQQTGEWPEINQGDQESEAAVGSHHNLPSMPGSLGGTQVQGKHILGASRKGPPFNIPG